MERLSYLISHFARSGSDKDCDALYRLCCGQGNGPLVEDGVVPGEVVAGPDGGVVDLEAEVDLGYHVVNFTD